MTTKRPKQNAKAKLDGILRTVRNLSAGMTIKEIAEELFDVRPSPKRQMEVKRMLPDARKRFAALGVAVTTVYSTAYGDHGAVERVLVWDDYSALDVDGKSRVSGHNERRVHAAKGLGQSTLGELVLQRQKGLPAEVLAAIDAKRPVTDEDQNARSLPPASDSGSDIRFAF